MGWDQKAGDVRELSSFGYAVYVDGTRSEASNVSCGETPGAAGFPCTCRLPPLAQGSHSLQVAAYVNDAGTVRESDRSAALQVILR